MQVDVDDEITFGKYEGETFGDIAEKNPGYIIWLSENIEWLELPEDLIDECEMNRGLEFEDE